MPFALCQPRLPAPVDSGWNRLLGFVLPPRCVLCGRAGQSPCHDLCAACQADLPAVPGGGLCTDSQLLATANLGSCERSFALCAYAPPVDTLIHALKYGGQLAIGRVLGWLLGCGVADAGLHLDVDCVLPVPLHPRRHAERGFNQSAEIARFAAGRIGLPVEPRLATRCRETRPQVGLPPSDRRANLDGAFLAVAGAVHGSRIAIVDDVMTTGSTAGELARALRLCGAVSVEVWCVARATAYH